MSQRPSRLQRLETFNLFCCLVLAEYLISRNFSHEVRFLRAYMRRSTDIYSICCNISKRLTIIHITMTHPLVSHLSITVDVYPPSDKMKEFSRNSTKRLQKCKNVQMSRSFQESNHNFSRILAQSSELGQFQKTPLQKLLLIPSENTKP